MSTCARSSVVSSVRGACENLQLSPFLQPETVWKNLHGNSPDSVQIESERGNGRGARERERERICIVGNEN